MKRQPFTRGLAIAVTASCLSLAACGTTGTPQPDRVVVQKSYIPVPTPCAVDPGPEPAWFDTPSAIETAGTILDLAKIYAAGRQQHIDWEARLKAANAGCRGADTLTAPLQ